MAPDGLRGAASGPGRAARHALAAPVAGRTFGRILAALLLALLVSCALALAAPAEKAHAGVTTGQWKIYYGSSSSSHYETTVTKLEDVVNYFANASYPWVKIQCEQTSLDYDAGVYEKRWYAPRSSTRIFTCSPGVSALYWSGSNNYSLLNLYNGATLVVGERVTFAQTNRQSAVYSLGDTNVYVEGVLKANSAAAVVGESGWCNVHRATSLQITTEGRASGIRSWLVNLSKGDNVSSVGCADYLSVPYSALGEYWFDNNATATLKATTTNSNYYVPDWTAPSGSNTYSTSRQMNSDYTATVSAAKKWYYVSYKNGTTEVARPYYYCGDTGYFPRESDYSALRRTGYTLDGWTNEAQTEVWSPGASFMNLSTVQGSTVNRYAVYRANTYTVHFEGNGADRGMMDDQTFTYNVKQALSKNTFTRAGWKFSGWSRADTSTTADYIDEQTVGNLTPAANGTVTLYAVWERNLFAFNTPDPVQANGLTASVVYDPPSPAAYGSTVSAHVQVRGTATASGVHLVTLKSDSLMLDQEITMQTVRGAVVNEDRTFTFTVPTHDTDDVQLGNEVAVLPDLYNQGFYYDGSPKPYLISSAIDGVEVESVSYAKLDSSEPPTTDAPVDAGTYEVLIALRMQDGGSSVSISKTLTVRQKPLAWNVEGLTAHDKEYDGAVDAVVEGAISVDGVEEADVGRVEVERADVARGQFLSAACGIDKPVEPDASAAALTGERAGNYALSASPPPALYADISGLVPGVVLGEAHGVTYNGHPQRARAVGDGPLVTFTDPAATSVVLNGAHEEQVAYTYYVDAGCLQKTTPAVGAADIGGSPAHAGTYYVKATFAPGAGQEQYNPVESAAVEFSIALKTAGLSAAWADPLVDSVGVTYTGQPLKPQVVCRDGIVLELLEGVDYDVAYADNVNVGPASAHVEFTGNYRGQADLSFRVNQAVYPEDALKATFPTVVDEAYDGLPHPVECDPFLLLPIDPQLSAAYRYIGVEGTSYDSANPPTDVGTYEVTATITTGNSNYRFPPSEGGGDDRYLLKARLSVAYDTNVITFKLDGGTVDGSGADIVWPDAHRCTALKRNHGGVPAPVKPGYVLAGWESDGAVYAPARAGEEEVRDDRAYTAVWEAADVDVTFEGNGGAFKGGADAKTYAQPYRTSFDFAKIAQPAREGSVFVGWAETKEQADAGDVVWKPGDMTGLFSFDAPAGKSYFASWESAVHTIALYYNGGTVSAEGAEPERTRVLSVPHGEALGAGGRAIDTPVLSDKKFLGWSDANALSPTPMDTIGLRAVTATRDATYVATWNGESFVTTTFEAFDGAASTTSYKVPKIPTPTPIAHPVAKPAAGGEFRAWRVSESSDVNFPVGAEFSDADLFDNAHALAGDVTFEAVWGTAQHAVAFELNGGTLVGGELSQEVAHGASPSRVAVKRAGYVLDGWLDVGMNVLVKPEDVASTPIEADTVFLAQWTRDLKAIAFDANGGEPSRTLDVQAGATVDVSTVAAPRRDGFSFAGWATSKTLADQGIADVTASGQTVRTIAADTTFWAVWSNLTYRITFQGADGVVVEERPVPFGGAIGATFAHQPGAPPRDGKAFSGWSIVSSGSVAVLDWSAVMSVVPASDLVFTAAYTDVEHTLTFSVAPGTGGPAPLTRPWGSSLALADVAAPAPLAGYSFAGWFDGPGEGAARLDAFDFKWDATAYALYEGDDVAYEVAHYTQGLDGGWEPAVSDSMTGAVGTDPVAIERTFAGFAYDASRTTYESSEHPAPTSDVLPLAADGSLVVKMYYPRSTVSAFFSTAGDVPDNEPDYRKKLDARFGERVSLPDNLAREGYTFGGWLPQAAYPPEYDPVARTFLMPAAQVAFVGTWKANDYFVHYDLDGGQGAFADEHPYHAGERAAVLAGEPTKVGSTFGGWRDGQGNVYREGDSVPVGAADVRLTAVWDVATYSLTFEAGDAPVPAPSPIEGHAGDATALPDALAWDGRSFVGWEQASDGAVLGAGSPYTVPASDESFTAQWRAVGYSVSYDLAGGSGDVRDDAAHYAGDEVDIVATRPVRDGYAFDGWTKDGVAVAGSFTMPASNVTLSAVWLPNTGMLHFDLAGGEDPDGAFDDRSVSTGDVLTLPAERPVLDGSAFMGWLDAGGTLRQPGEDYAVPPLGDGPAALTALWSAADDFGVTYDLAGGAGAGIEDDGRYRAGDAVTVVDKVPVLDGMRFAGWTSTSDGNVYGAGEQLIMPAADVTLTATWKADAVYTAAFDGNGGEPGRQELTGTAGTVAACPDAPVRKGYAFDGWLAGDGTLYAAGEDFAMPEADAVLVAQWTGLPCTVRFDAAGGSPVPDPIGASYGDTVALPDAPVLEGMVFAGWSDGSAAFAAGASYPVLASDAVLVAQWAPDGFSISYDLGGGAFLEAAPPRYVHGESFAFPVPEREDASFAGWYADGDPARPKDGVSPEDAADLHVAAAWDVGTHELAANVPSFEAVQAGTWPAARPIMLANTGSLDTSVLSVTSSSDAFVVSGTGPEVPVGGSIDTWRLRPASNLEAGTYEAVITVSYRDTDGAVAQATGETSLVVTPGPSPDPPAPGPSPTPPGGGTVTGRVLISNGSVAGAAPNAAEDSGNEDAEAPAAGALASHGERAVSFKLTGGTMLLEEDADGVIAVRFEPAEHWEFKGLVVDGEAAQPDGSGAYVLPALGDHTLEVTFAKTGLAALLDAWWLVALVFFVVGAAVHALAQALRRRLHRKTDRTADSARTA